MVLLRVRGVKDSLNEQCKTDEFTRVSLTVAVKSRKRNGTDANTADSKSASNREWSYKVRIISFN